MKVNEIYNSVASEYEELINSPRMNATMLDDLKKIFLKYNIKQGSILDLGCGPGNLQGVLGDSFSYTGVDVADKMLDIAEKRGYKTILGKVEDKVKEIPDKSYDYVVSVSALHFVPRVEEFFSEFERIAKKGWLITLPEITKHYADNFPVEEELYDHSKLEISRLSEDLWTKPWTSVKTGDQIRERMVFKLT